MFKRIFKKKKGESREPLECTDYIFCEDCKAFIDFYKYDRVEDSGHGACNWRFVSGTELKTCVQECIEEGCFDEE